MSNQGALATLDDDAALAEMANGTLMRQIAARFNCSKVAVYKRLSKHPDYAQTIKYQAESFVEEALDQVMKCDANTVNIARARFDACHKWAAARDPTNWAPRQQIIAVTVIQAADALSGEASTLLDQLRTVSVATAQTDQSEQLTLADHTQDHDK